MNIEDLQKIWMANDEQPHYRFDQAAMERWVKQRARRVQVSAILAEYGILFIAIGAIALLWLLDRDPAYRWAATVTLAGISLYVLNHRYQRRKAGRTIDLNVLAALDRSINDAKFLALFAQRFVYWFILPTLLLTCWRSWHYQASLGTMAFSIAGFALAYALVRWELKAVHQPRVRKLEALREKLLEKA